MMSYPEKKKKCKIRKKSIAVSGSLDVVSFHCPFSNSNFVHAYACVSKRVRPAYVHLGFSVDFFFLAWHIDFPVLWTENNLFKLYFNILKQ